MNIKKILGGGAAGALMLGASIVPAFASTETVYDALPSVSPETNYPSLGFQATQTSEFGDYIHLDGTARALNTVTVTMSDWAKYSDYDTDTSYSGDSANWTHPITLNVYNVVSGTPNTVGTLLGTVTQTITIPWRPESDSSCGATSNGTGWKKDGVCYNYSGIAFNATFDLSSLNVTLPGDIIVSVAYNTQSYGASPIGSNGPYNSLNVAVPPGQSVAVGRDDNTDNVFWNTSTAAWYTDGGTGGVGIFREDTNWTPNGTVALQVTARTPEVTASVNGGGHLLNGEGKKKDLLDISFGGNVNQWSDDSLSGEWNVVLHNVGNNALDKSHFNGSEITALNFFDGDDSTCNDAVNFTVNGTFNGDPASMIFRAGDFGSPNTADTARITIYHGLDASGGVVYDTHSTDFPGESSCVGSARTGIDNGNITIN